MPSPSGSVRYSASLTAWSAMPGRSSQTEHVCRKGSERHPVGQEEGEVVQAEPAAPRHRRDTRLLDKVRERRCAFDAERSSTCATFEHVHTEHALVVLDRALQVADLQANRADVSLLRQTRWPGNSIALRSLSHSRTHRFTPVFHALTRHNGKLRAIKKRRPT